MFTNQDLKKLIIPLFLEQLLVALVGIADVFVIGFVGEAAVSGVSLVNAFNMIFINLFTALASGGAVVISQYIGKKDKEQAGAAASQLLTASVLLSVVISVVVLVANEQLMRLMFGKVEDDVMAACVTYLRISAYSYPAMAIYNAGAALYRSFGKTSTTMYLSIASNVINVVGNCIGVFALHAGVPGVAVPSLIARIFSAAVITVLCFSKRNPVQYLKEWIFKVDLSFQKTILSIAVPNGIESGIFQLVKVALSSVVALFGTYQIAANGIAQSIWSMAALTSSALSPVFITVIGQCMGAGDTDQAEYYFRKLIKITLIIGVAWNALVFAVTLLHNIFNGIALCYAGPLGSGLRATGDVKFTMGISLFTTIGVRLIFSVIFAIWMNMGVMGIALAMCLDWSVRGIIFWWRFKQGKWKTFQVIRE